MGETQEATKVTAWDVNDVEAFSVRWGAFAKVWFLTGGWSIIAQAYERDYQGFGAVLAKRGYEAIEYRLIHWDYGSCSGCDGYEDRPEEEVIADFGKLVMTVNGKDQLLALAKNDGWVKDLVVAAGDEVE